MFSFLKAHPAKKLKKQYAETLEKAMLAQRSGNIRLYSQLSTDAEAIYKKIQLLEVSP